MAVPEVRASLATSAATQTPSGSSLTLQNWPDDGTSSVAWVVASGQPTCRTTVGGSEGDTHYARLRWQGMSIGQGETFWLGLSVYLPSNFYTIATNYFRLMSLDTFTSSNGAGHAGSTLRNGLWFHSPSNGWQSIRGENNNDGLVLFSLSSSFFPVSTLLRLVFRYTLSGTPGSATTQLYINGTLRGSNTTDANFRPVGSDSFNSANFGIDGAAQYDVGKSMTFRMQDAALSASSLLTGDPAPLVALPDMGILTRAGITAQQRIGFPFTTTGALTLDGSVPAVTVGGNVKVGSKLSTDPFPGGGTYGSALTGATYGAKLWGAVKNDENSI